jgi:hypothetical protein
LAHPRSGAILVSIQVSSMKTSRLIEPGLPGSPALPPVRDVGAGLLKGEQCFFEPQALTPHEQPDCIVRTLTPRVVSASLKRCSVNGASERSAPG